MAADEPAPSKPTTGGLSAADFIADPEKAIAKLRAEIRQEIIGTNVIAACVLYLLLAPKGRGGLF